MLSPSDAELFKGLSSPAKIQDFLNALAMRTHCDEPIVSSPREAIKRGSASCMEGALIAAAALAAHGREAILLDLKVGVRNTSDVDHVVALFKEDGLFGAISKTGHAVLRYREPVYASVRELAMSYFHEYFTDDGKKNMRSYSAPFDVIKNAGTKWVSSPDDLYEIAALLDASPHTDILTPKSTRKLRLADTIEIAAGKITE